jgi:NTP pyrophosphatase (non-canonical NTP hydrolase)
MPDSAWRPTLILEELHLPVEMSSTSRSDSATTVAELRQLIADFVAERDWSQFHSPKNVSMALAIEAAELMEHFQWLTTEASRALAEDPHKLAEVGEELADVIGYSFALANELGIDVSRAIRAKMVKNAQKYPADQYRGRYGPEDQR